jgi:NADH dehydrogenase FAD-containing subunit
MKEVKKYAYNIKDPENAIRLREKLLTMKNGKVIIAGGGITGVEVAVEAREITPKEVSITILEGAHRVLLGLDEKIAKKTERELMKKGISAFTNARIKSYDKKEVLLDNKKKFQCDVLVWCAGITPNTIDVNITRSPRGHIITNEFLQSLDDEKIYALGDCASTIHDKKPVAWTAHNAMEQGMFAAENIRRKTIGFEYEPYIPTKLPLVISLGSKQALMAFEKRSTMSPLIRPLKNILEIFYVTTRR